MESDTHFALLLIMSECKNQDHPWLGPASHQGHVSSRLFDPSGCYRRTEEAFEVNLSTPDIGKVTNL